jgi:perosamine synthetase
MLPVTGLFRPTASLENVDNEFPGCRVYRYSRGREILADFARAGGIGPGEAILVPAYICSAVLEPLEKLGIKVVFYPIDENFDPDTKAIRELLLLQRPRAILIVHYFGFLPDVQAVVQECRDQGVWIIEDCAQTLPSQDISVNTSFGDLTIYSLPKLLPLPDGALAVVHNRALPWLDPPNTANKRLTRINSLWQIANTAEVLLGASLRTRLRDNRRTATALTHFRESPANNGESHSYNCFRMSGIARWLNKKIDLASVVTRRKANYEWLLAATKSIKGVRPAFGNLLPHAAPLGFPIIIDDREKVRSRLISSGVDPRPIWSALPPQVPVDGFPVARHIAAHNVVLPVHQDLSARVLTHIVSSLERALAS